MRFVEWSSNKIEDGARALFKSPVLLIGGILVVAALKAVVLPSPGGLDD